MAGTEIDKFIDEKSLENIKQFGEGVELNVKAIDKATKATDAYLESVLKLSKAQTENKTSIKELTEEQKKQAEIDKKLSEAKKAEAIAEKKRLKDIEAARKKEAAAELKRQKQIERTTVAFQKTRSEQQKLEQRAKMLAKVQDTATGSIARQRVALVLLTQKYDGANKAMRDRLAPTIDRLSKKIEKQENITNRHTRGVGNYAKGWNGMSNSINQLTREMPAFANSVQTGFMAISNNLPIFFDEISKIRQQNTALAADGKKTQSVLGQVAKSFFSWGTALSVGVVLLTVYGKEMVEFIGGLIKTKKAFDVAKKSKEAFNEAIVAGRKSVVEETTKLNILYNTLIDTNKSLVERNEAQNELNRLYPDLLDGLTQEEILTGKASKRYIELTNSIIKAAKARALQDKIVETTRKIIDEEEKLDKIREKQNKNLKQQEFWLNQTNDATGASAFQVSTLKIQYSTLNKEVEEATKNIKGFEDVNKKLAAKIDLTDIFNTDFIQKELDLEMELGDKALDAEITRNDKKIKDAKRVFDKKTELLEEQADIEKQIDSELGVEKKQTTKQDLDDEWKITEDSIKDNAKKIKEANKIFRTDEQKQKKEAKEREEEEADLFEEKRQLKLDVADEAANAGADLLFEKGTRRREAELADLEEKLNLGQITQEQFDRKKEALDKKQARSDKRRNILGIILDTFRAVAKAGFITPTAIATGIAGGIVLGKAIATPAFAEGTHGKYNTPETGYWAGEAGTEAKIDKSGNVTLVDKPTFFQGSQHANNRIIPNNETKMLMAGGNSGNNLSNDLLKKLIFTTEQMNRKKSVNNININAEMRHGESIMNMKRKFRS
jgi:hypothetical protein